VAGFLKNIDYLQAIKREGVVKIARGCKAKYSHMERCDKLDVSWFSGLLDDEDGEALELYRADKNICAWMVVRNCSSIRSYHKQGEYAR
jgi:hypothetical protein